jgi:hypothetical protein
MLYNLAVSVLFYTNVHKFRLFVYVTAWIDWIIRTNSYYMKAVKNCLQLPRNGTIRLYYEIKLIILLRLALCVVPNFTSMPSQGWPRQLPVMVLITSPLHPPLRWVKW